MLLGSENIKKTFNFGNETERMYLYPLYLVSSFILVIHMLNMIIAIMSETFEERNAHAEQIRLQAHLIHVKDTWNIVTLFENWINWYRFRHYHRTSKYIICAFSVQEKDHENKIIKETHDSIEKLHHDNRIIRENQT